MKRSTFVLLLLTAVVSDAAMAGSAVDCVAPRLAAMNVDVNKVQQCCGPLKIDQQMGVLSTEN